MISLVTSVEAFVFPDVDGNHYVDVRDIYAVSRAYGSTPEASRWNQNCDFNNDSSIDIKDYYYVCKYFGKTEAYGDLNVLGTFNGLPANFTAYCVSDVYRSGDANVTTEGFTWENLLVNHYKIFATCGEFSLKQEVDVIENNTVYLNFEFANTSDVWYYGNKVANWLLTSGIVDWTSNRVHEGAKFVNDSWQIEEGSYRVDAQHEVAMAMLYYWKETGNAEYKNKAIALIKQARVDSNECFATSIDPKMRQYVNTVYVTFYAPFSIISFFTQDNGKTMRILALAVELTSDSEIRTYLTQCADWFVAHISGDGSVGVGINSVRGGDYMNPPQYVSARQVGSLLVGMIQAYEAVGKIEYKDSAEKLGNWLVNNQATEGNWFLPTSPDLYNNGLGNEVEACSESLRGLSELFNLTGNEQYRLSAERASYWLKKQCDQTDSHWNMGKVPSEFHRSSDYRYFNTLYMCSHAGLLASDIYHGDATARTYAYDIMIFMGSKMMQTAQNVNGAICGEWDLSTNARSQFLDDERIVWGNWCYCGWTNCEFIEACGMYS